MKDGYINVITQLHMCHLGKLPKDCPHNRWLCRALLGEIGEFYGVRFVEVSSPSLQNS